MDIAAPLWENWPLLNLSVNLLRRGDRHVRFGSKADILGGLPDVRFTPKSGHRNSVVGCPLCAISGLLQRSKHHLSELPDNGFHRAPAK
jgi:hypothetical protein